MKKLNYLKKGESLTIKSDLYIKSFTDIENKFMASNYSSKRQKNKLKSILIKKTAKSYFDKKGNFLKKRRKKN